MSKSPSIKKNLIYSTLYQIIIIIVPLITAPYTSRIFGAYGVGIQSYTNSIVSYFTLFAALGTASYGQREIARSRDNKEEVTRLFWEIELLSVITTSICILLWLIVIVTGGEYSPYYVVLTMNIIAVAFDISWFFGGFEQFQFVFIRNAAIRIIGIGILFIFVREKNDLLLYIGLLAATGMLGNLSMWTYLPKFLAKINIKQLKVKRHFRETLVYFIPTIATSIYNVADRTMLGLITHDPYENGYYEQANKVVNMAKAVLFSINTVMTSRMSYLLKNGSKEEFTQRLHTSMNAILFCAIPMCWGISSIASAFVPIFFGDGYDKVIPLMCISSVFLIIIGMSNCMERQYFTPSGKKRLSNKFVIAGACINFILNLLMISHYGSYGACVASVIAESVVTILYMYYGRKQLPIKSVVLAAYKYMIAGAIMFVGVQILIKFMTNSLISLLLEIASGAFIYIFVLFVSRDKFFYECIDKYLKPVLRKCFK